MSRRLRPMLVPDWPKLAWVSRLQPLSIDVPVWHGPMVEVAEDWLAEAVWDGDFQAGHFDQTDLVFGSGIRVRGDNLHVVNSATMVDRLWHVQKNGAFFVSNSLPAILAAAELELRDDYPRYVQDIGSIDTQGYRGYQRSIVTRSQPVDILYYDNLAFDGQQLRVLPKPRKARQFVPFAAYRDFLVDTARRLVGNCVDPARRYPVAPLVGVSSGYDSPAVAAVAKAAGCVQAVTIANATALLPSSDDGSAVAAQLGMSCRSYIHHPSAYRNEIAVWAACGHPGGLNLTIFDYPQPLSLLLAGNYGDTVWNKAPRDISNPLGDSDALISEFRLAEGVFHCLVPWWGIWDADQINRLGATPEMQPWSIGGSYDRPVPRRLAEEAGAAREAFGRRKRLTASNRPFRWPYSREAQRQFRNYLRARGVYAPGRLEVALLRRAVLLLHLIRLNVKLPGWLRDRLEPWRAMRCQSMLFQWANWELKQTYQNGLHLAGRDELKGSSGDFSLGKVTKEP